MRAITIRQPYALCVASGHKTVENRGRPTSIRGEIAIHAAKAHSPAGDVDPRVVRLWGPDARVGAPLGAIIAVAELVDCHQAEQLVADASCCWPWGDRTYNGKSGWHLALNGVRRLDNPVYCRGSLQVGWNVPADVEEQVRADLAAQERAA